MLRSNFWYVKVLMFLGNAHSFIRDYLRLAPLSGLVDSGVYTH